MMLKRSGRPSRRDVLAGGVALSAMTGVAAARPSARAASGLSARGEYLMRGGHVLSVDPRIGDVPGGEVHIRDGVIVAVGSRLSAPRAEVIDATGMIVMPGFIEVHWHMWNSLWRGLAQDAAEYFALHRLADFYTPADHDVAVRYAAVEALNAGVTTCHNWAHGLRSQADAEAEMRALVDTGIRSRFGYGPPDDAAGGPAGRSGLAAAHRWLAANGDGGRVSLGLVVHDEKRLVQDVTEARALGLKTVGPHVDLSRHARLIGPDFLFTHGAGMSPAALRQIVASKMKVGLCPHTDPLIGAGLPPLFEMMEAGVRFADIGFSVDVNCQTAVDPFSAMRVLLNAARIAQMRAAGVTDFQGVITRREPVGLMRPRQIIELATINGARVLGLEQVTGSLTPGKRADLIMVRTDAPNMLPAHDVNPTLQIVQHGLPSNVDTVIVDGRILKSGGRIVGVDPVALSIQAARAQRGIRERARLPAIDMRS